MYFVNYYNEHDPRAAAWIRELIAAGEIPPGDVDERSITEVKPHEITHYTQHHFFAGIAGWPLALRLAGIPDSRRIATASLPCQPFSAAGQQKGAGDDRHLWPVFFNLAKECGFERIFGEQVARAIGFNWLDGISADLEAAGYTVGSIVLGAHSVGAPHRRQRLYWVADAPDRRRTEHEREPRERGDKGPPDATEYSRTGRNTPSHRDDDPRARPHRLADSERTRLEGQPRHERDGDEPGRERADATRPTAESGRAGVTVAQGDAKSGGRREQRDAPQQGRSGHPDSADSKYGGIPPYPTERMDDPTSPRRDGTFREAEGEARNKARMRLPRAGCPWDNYTIIPCRDGKSRRIPRLAQPIFQSDPDGVSAGVDGGWLQSDGTIFPLAKGVQGRTGLLRGAGNAIVPQLAAEFIRACEDIL